VLDEPPFTLIDKLSRFPNFAVVCSSSENTININHLLEGFKPIYIPVSRLRMYFYSFSVV
jgi:hypothetical protein